MGTVSVKGLSKSYKEKEVLKDISFELRKGDVVGYLGKNGSGKTTTINILVGLLKADKGKVVLLGKNIDKEYSELCGKIGIMFDENGLYGKMTVKQNLDYFIRLFRADCGQNRDFFEQLYREMNYENIKNMQVNKLSKGMKRMVTLVRTLMLQPEILILDEPFDGIDIENRSKFIRLIQKYYEEKQPTILLTSHVMADIEELATRIVILKDGRIVIDDSMEEFRKRATKRTVYAGFRQKEELKKAEVTVKKQYPLCKIIVKGQTIEIQEFADSMKQMQNLLSEQDIDCDELYQKQQSLSDIYLELIND